MCACALQMMSEGGKHPDLISAPTDAAWRLVRKGVAPAFSAANLRSDNRDQHPEPIVIVKSQHAARHAVVHWLTNNSMLRAPFWPHCRCKCTIRCPSSRIRIDMTPRCKRCFTYYRAGFKFTAAACAELVGVLQQLGPDEAVDIDEVCASRTLLPRCDAH